jgi:tetratricopeptide (TPR) repeat protein
MEYGNQLFSLANHQAILGVILLCGIIILISKTRSERNIVFFSASWFMLCLLPSANLYPINAYMAEHWLYLPSIGLFLVVSKALASLYQKNRLKSLGIAITITLVASFSFLTFKQNSYWKKTIPFYERTLRYAPQSFKVYYNLGNEYRLTGDYENSITAYNKAIKLNPQDADVYYNLGVAYSDIGENKKAIEQYKAAIGTKPFFDKAYYNSGNAYYQLGDIPQALDCYKKTIEINPLHVNAYNNLGVAYNSLGDKIKAETTFKKAMEVDPRDGTAYCNLAIFYFGQAEFDKAVQYYESAEKKGFVDLKFSQKLAPYRK